LDPDDAVRARRQSLQSENVETHHMGMPPRLPLQEKSSGANDLALLAPGNGAECSAKDRAAALSNFDDGENLSIEAHEIQFSGFAAQVACQYKQASRLKILHGELFRCGTPLPAGFCEHGHEHAPADGNNRHR
jgi:hypothetical protein